MLLVRWCIGAEQEAASTLPIPNGIGSPKVRPGRFWAPPCRIEVGLTKGFLGRSSQRLRADAALHLWNLRWPSRALIGYLGIRQVIFRLSLWELAVETRSMTISSAGRAIRNASDRYIYPHGMMRMEHITL
jgi:hypothetical protein